MWYLMHQRATQIIEEHEREIQRIRLARLVAEGRQPSPPRPLLAGPRRVVARAMLVVGRSATRIAHAVDSDVEAARAA